MKKFVNNTKIVALLLMCSTTSFVGCLSISQGTSASKVQKGTPLRNKVQDLERRLERGSPRDYELAEYFLIAESLMQQKQFDLAEKLYSAVFESEPSLVVGLKIARIKSLQRKFGEAEDVIKKLNLFYPKSAEPSLELALHYQLQGNRTKTLQILEHAYKNHPTSEDISTRYAEFLLDSGQRERAKKVLTDSLKRLPNSQYFLVKLAQLKADEKDYGEAKNLLNSLLRYYPENVEAWALAGFIASEEDNTAAAESYFREAFERQPENDSLARYYVVQLLKQNKLEEARRLLLKLEASTEEEAQFDTELSFQLAYVLFQLEDYAEAKKRFLSLVEHTSDPGRLFYYAGQSDELRNDLPAADVEYLKVPEQSSFYSLAVQRRIYLTIEKGDFDKAREMLKEVKLSKEDGETSYRFVATLYAKVNDYKSAQKVLNAGLKEFPKSTELGYLSAAYLEHSQSRVASLTAMEKFVQRNPNFSPALNHLGYMLAEKGLRLEFAETLLKRAVQKEPTNGFYRDSLGWALFRLKKYDEAEKELLAALKEEKDEPVIMEHLGELKFAKKQYAEALKYFEMAENTFSTHPKWKIESDSEWKQSFERVKKRVQELRQMALPKPKSPETDA